METHFRGFRWVQKWLWNDTNNQQWAFLFPFFCMLCIKGTAAADWLELLCTNYCPHPVLLVSSNINIWYLGYCQPMSWGHILPCATPSVLVWCIPGQGKPVGATTECFWPCTSWIELDERDWPVSSSCCVRWGRLEDLLFVRETAKLSVDARKD